MTNFQVTKDSHVIPQLKENNINSAEQYYPVQSPAHRIRYFIKITVVVSNFHWYANDVDQSIFVLESIPLGIESHRIELWRNVLIYLSAFVILRRIMALFKGQSGVRFFICWSGLSDDKWPGFWEIWTCVYRLTCRRNSSGFMGSHNSFYKTTLLCRVSSDACYMTFACAVELSTSHLG